MKYKIDRWKEIKENLTKKQYNKYYQKVLKIYKHNLKKMKKDNFNELIRFDNDDDKELYLTDEDYEILSDNKLLSEPFFYNEGPSFLIICDDILGSNLTSIKKSNPLNQLIANHRHLIASIFLIIQSFSSGIPRNIRRILSQYFLFKFTDLKEIENFYKEISSTLFSSFDEFKHSYQQITNEPHNFMLIDNDPLNDKLAIRKNFDNIIKL